jgi:alcohol dehydrogenase
MTAQSGLDDLPDLLRADDLPTRRWRSSLEGIELIGGDESLRTLTDVGRALGCHRALLVTDPGVAEAGHSGRARERLEEAGISVLPFDQVEANPTEANVRAGARAARDHQADLLVAVGGGSAMDCSKGINFVVSCGGEIADYEGYGKASAAMMPMVAVPTTAGTGSDAQSYALISTDATHRKMACGDPGARFRTVILDPSVTDTLPRSIAAASGLDAVSHALESFVAKNRCEASSAYARRAWKILDRHLLAALDAPGDHRRWSQMQVAAHLAGAAIERSMLGAAHACANPLTSHHRTTHGVAVVLMLPHVIRYNASVAGMLYAELYDPSAGETSAENLALRVQAMIEAANQPLTLSELGIGRDELPHLASEAASQWTLQFNPRSASTADLLEIYESAF